MTAAVARAEPFDIVEAGLATFPWWKDWRGKACAIVCSGQSVKNAGVEKLKGRLPVIAVKQGIELCPWADVVYGCDIPWWKHRKGLPEFKGTKIGFWPKIREMYPDVNLIEIKTKTKRPSTTYVDELLFDQPGLIGAGANSGFMALNIAAQFGVDRVLFVGLDLCGQHFYGRNNWDKANNAGDSDFRRWRKIFEASVPVLRASGIEVLNASRDSALHCFRKVTIDQALEEWRL